MVTSRLSEGRVLIPDEVRAAAHLEDGQALELIVTSLGILVRPAAPIDPPQAWFWTPEWLAGEIEADLDIAAGRTRRFESTEEFFKALDEEASADADI